jgi:choline dehydrogenase-like flavoprotein
MSQSTNVMTSAPERIRTEHLVIGSGPGGSVTAGLLAEAGREVLLLEEGRFLRLDSCPPFSREEMLQKYRNAGLTIAMGRPKIQYVEGCCVGGGSEINSGLYLQPPAELLEEWRKSHQVEALSEDDLRRHCEANERDLVVSLMTGTPPRPALKLREGAERLGWKSREIPCWCDYSRPAEDGGMRQTMTKTFVQRALAAGTRLLPSTRAHRLKRRGRGWLVRATQQGEAPRNIEIEADKVFIAGGAIQTPTLLLRSGVGRNAGNSLHLHPTVKVVARFADLVNSSDMGIPPQQVDEFYPRYRFGCSISALPYLELAMVDQPAHAKEVVDDWQRAAVYYAMTRGGVGRVRSLPFFRDAVVHYRLERHDLEVLALALRDLCRCLMAAGAVTLYPGIVGCPRLSTTGDLASLPAALPADRTRMMTIHLFSSCPMGEDRTKCTANSFGRVHGEENLWIADASLLPGPPGLNPQGTIMAIVRRNVEHFLGNL